ncbi:MAG: radical SAM (seleno)protein TrsS [Syntrophobacteraceae bacterium]
MPDEIILSTTESVCPECLAKIPAVRVQRGDEVFLKKKCPLHGEYQAVIWRGNPSYSSWNRPKIPYFTRSPLTGMEHGCPLDCGLCPEHRQETCCTLIEVTQKCNLRCNFCFADAGGSQSKDPDLGQIRSMYETLVAAGGPYNVQLSGGEPTIRDDLPDIIALGRSLGFEFIQINTNGLRLAADALYLDALREAGLSCVFLQFDGLRDDVYKKLRGRNLLKEKERAVSNCIEREIGVILVPTLVPGVNVDQIGPVIDFAIENLPGIRGVHFQPVSYFGRYPDQPADKDRLTLPEVIREIEVQTAGRIRAENLKPSGCYNPFCSFHGNFISLESGELRAWTTRDPEQSCCRKEKAEEGAAKARRFVTQFWTSPPKPDCSREDSFSLGGWDAFLDRARTHSISISAMVFQDAWNLDLERLKDCSIHVVHLNRTIIPFCAYNLTDRNGRSLYRLTGLTGLKKKRMQERR